MALMGQPGCDTGAVYLMGYAAELVLKVAVCELLGISASADPWAQVRSLGISLGDVRNHDIMKLWKQANDRREGLGLDVRDPAFHGSLRFHAWTIYTHWWEELRYKNEQATPKEVAEVAEATFWLLTNLEEICK